MYKMNIGTSEHAQLFIDFRMGKYRYSCFPLDVHTTVHITNITHIKTSEQVQLCIDRRMDEYRYSCFPLHMHTTAHIKIIQIFGAAYTHYYRHLYTQGCN